ncbi:MAG: MASE1 domain-containing protein, partial [Vicinamibacteria bacterium]
MLLAVGVAAAYFVSGRLGLALALVHPSATVVWPPTGVALAAMILFGRWLWPVVFAAAFLVNVTTAGSWPASLGIATGNTLEAVVGSCLAERFAGGKAAFERPAGV